MGVEYLITPSKKIIGSMKQDSPRSSVNCLQYHEMLPFFVKIGIMGWSLLYRTTENLHFFSISNIV
jgi:hypothetical protein